MSKISGSLEDINGEFPAFEDYDTLFEQKQLTWTRNEAKKIDTVT